VDIDDAPREPMTSAQIIQKALRLQCDWFLVVGHCDSRPVACRVKEHVEVFGDKHRKVLAGRVVAGHVPDAGSMVTCDDGLFQCMLTVTDTDGRVASEGYFGENR